MINDDAVVVVFIVKVRFILAEGRIAFNPYDRRKQQQLMTRSIKDLKVLFEWPNLFLKFKGMD